MKSFFIALVLAIILIGTAIFHLAKLEDISDKLLAINNDIFISVNNENFDEAGSKLSEIKDNIKSVDVFWSAMGNHEETDNIKSAISELDIYIREHDRTDALAKSKLLSLLFSHMPESSSVKAENIF